MSKLYSKVYELEKNIYVEGAPVIISAGALLKNNQNGSMLSQLKITNLSSKKIMAATISITAKSVTDSILGEPIRFQYLDLSIDRNGQFGTQTPIQMADMSTRIISVTIDEVVFSDQTTWKNNIGEGMPLPTQENILETITDMELQKQYKIIYGDNAKYSLCEGKSLWQCTCGLINYNVEDKCFGCYVEKSKLKKFSMENLKLDLEKRKLLEESEEISVQKKAKKEKIDFLISFLTISIVGITALFFLM